MKQQTVIISDLHLGGGAADPGDDHVYQGQQLARFIEQLLGSDAGRSGAIELFINGDFLEFAQTLQDAYKSPSPRYWCSEAQSIRKLDAILAGHPRVFSLLGSLIDRRNLVTIAAGNHDVDLYWPDVQASLRQVMRPALSFELGKEWVTRYDGRLQIAHGHIKDPANTFEHWADPILDAPGGQRLEMCPGTLFMVKVVNFMEARYPFADNLHPVQQLGDLLWREEKSGYAAAAWALGRFMARHPKLMKIQGKDDFGPALLARVQKNDRVAGLLLAAAEPSAPTGEASLATWRTSVATEDQLADFLVEHWQQLDSAGVTQELSPGGGAMMGTGQTKVMGLIRKGGSFGRQALRDIASRRAEDEPMAQVVVMGHTHLPDDAPVLDGRARYFNPGSWTRYLDLEAHPALRLDDLRDESQFPYALNSVRVERGPGDRLIATLRSFEEQHARFG